MKRIYIILLIFLLAMACNTTSTIPNTPDNNATIAAGVMQARTEQANQTAIAETLQPGSHPQPPETAANDITPVVPPPFPTQTKVVPIGVPRLIVEYTPPIGSANLLSGRVEGVIPEEYEIAIYICVGGGWWNKPYFAQPTVPISDDGTWTVAYATDNNGNDMTATVIVVYLLKAGVQPPEMRGAGSLPTFDGVADYKVEKRAANLRCNTPEEK